MVEKKKDKTPVDDLLKARDRAAALVLKCMEDETFNALIPRERIDSLDQISRTLERLAAL